MNRKLSDKGKEHGVVNLYTDKQTRLFAHSLKLRVTVLQRQHI